MFKHHLTRQEKIAKKKVLWFTYARCCLLIMNDPFKMTSMSWRVAKKWSPWTVCVYSSQCEHSNEYVNFLFWANAIFYLKIKIQNKTRLKKLPRPICFRNSTWWLETTQFKVELIVPICQNESENSITQLSLVILFTLFTRRALLIFPYHFILFKHWFNHRLYYINVNNSNPHIRWQQQLIK